jgi:hypothetical protein
MKLQALWENKYYLLIVISFLIRLAVIAVYAPIGYADTGWYEKLAREIISWDFSNYDGARTPVYPILLILGFIRWKVIWLIQLGFGVANASLIYSVTFNATQNIKYSFWAGMIYNCTLVLMFFESNLLTETICIFFLLLTVFYFQKISKVTEEKNEIRKKDIIFLSLAISLATLTRPTFLYVFFLVFFFLVYVFKKYNIRGNLILKNIVLYVIPFIILVGGWSTFNKIKADYFGPTTLTGFHFIEHSGAFIEYAPDSYSDIKNIYLKHREIKINETGEQTCTIYMAYPEIQTAKNYSVAQVSKDLTSLSFWLFYHYPGLYFKSVLRAYFDFWYLPNFIDYWDLSKIRLGFLAGFLKYAVMAELYLWIVLNCVFILVFLYNMYLFFRGKPSQLNILILLLSSCVVALSVIQALVQYGDNWRFAVAMKPYIILVLVLTIYSITGKKKTKLLTETPSHPDFLLYMQALQYKDPSLMLTPIT